MIFKDQRNPSYWHKSVFTLCILVIVSIAILLMFIDMLIIPLIMTVNFGFNIIPWLDKYLEKKYGEEFRDYRKKTKKLIPLIY